MDIREDLNKVNGEYGGRAARNKTGPLWKFTDKSDGSFCMPDPRDISGLYFPLCNEESMKSFVTPELKGDICSDFNHYLTIPVVKEDLHRSNASRNVWVYVEGHKPWSITGVSAFARAEHWNSCEQAAVQAGPGWFHLETINSDLQLKAGITVFVPSSGEQVEVMKVKITNIGSCDMRFSPTAATPIFGRSCDHLRDHRHVTTMFNIVRICEHGVVVKPRIQHDENGHTENATQYAVLGFEEHGMAPMEIWGNLRDFVGEGGTLENPEAVFKHLSAPKRCTNDLSGLEAIGAMRFSTITLAPGRTAAYVILHGITEDLDNMKLWEERFGTVVKTDIALGNTVARWQELTSGVEFRTADSDFNNIMRWMNAQLVYRKVYGNSYLADFGYGRGGRGWRDLWSDLLSLFLIDPSGTRKEMLNIVCGCRVDGTNATIIGANPGEFKADRNNIVRVWSDHAAWPFFVLKFYIEQSGDVEILFQELPYWKDHLSMRCQSNDKEWNDKSGNEQQTRSGQVYRGTVLEHILVQVLSSFYNVGKHNNILLEGGDWNDTYDNARQEGESVCFTHWYAWNLRELGALLKWLDEQKGVKEIELLDEMLVLLDRVPGQQDIDYKCPKTKKQHLDKYMQSVYHEVSGKRSKVTISEIAADLWAKADFLFEHLRRNEWLKTEDNKEFFNGHYDNKSQRVHGDHPNGVRIDLTSQVLPTMFGTATEKHVQSLYESVIHYLRNPETGGLRLCSDFKEIKLDFGRVTGFVYGYKEHGAIWNQQNAMFMYGLYKRGFVREGFDVFNDVLKLIMDSGTSKIMPCVPSFFDKSGRGGYSYLTGAATWFVLAALTQMSGLRGKKGDLYIQPKLLKQQFDREGLVGVSFTFLGKRIEVTYVNQKQLDWEYYRIGHITMNGEEIDFVPQTDNITAVLVKQEVLLKQCVKRVNQLEIVLLELDNREVARPSRTNSV